MILKLMLVKNVILSVKLVLLMKCVLSVIQQLCYLNTFLIALNVVINVYNVMLLQVMESVLEEPVLEMDLEITILTVLVKKGIKKWGYQNV